VVSAVAGSGTVLTAFTTFTGFVLTGCGVGMCAFTAGSVRAFGWDAVSGRGLGAVGCPTRLGTGTGCFVADWGCGRGVGFGDGPRAVAGLERITLRPFAGAVCAFFTDALRALDETACPFAWFVFGFFAAAWRSCPGGTVFCTAI